MKTPKETIPRESSKLFLAVETNEVALDSYAQLNKSRITLSGIVPQRKLVELCLCKTKQSLTRGACKPKNAKSKE